MDLQQLVYANETLENLELIEDRILHQKKNLTINGLRMIDEIIDDCYTALSETRQSVDRGLIELSRINSLILETSLRIKRKQQEIREFAICA